MIIVNGQPKSGTTLLQNYIRYCGAELEPGGLMLYANERRLTMRGGKPWGSVRKLDEVLSDPSPNKVVSGHFVAGLTFPEYHKLIFIFRNPRDILVSTARWRAVGLDWTNTSYQPTPRDVRKQMTEKSFAAVAKNSIDFFGWLYKSTLSVAFEQLMITPEQTGELITDTVGLSYKDPREIFGDQMPWVTDSYRGTWSGKLSDWRDHWDASMQNLWKKHGGLSIEKEYGYDNEW